MMWDLSRVQHTEKMSSVLTGQTILDTGLCTVFGYYVVDEDYSPAEENWKTSLAICIHSLLQAVLGV